MIKRIKQLWGGYLVVRDWHYGRIGCATVEQTRQRAKICAGCPKNQKGNIFDSIVRWFLGFVYNPTECKNLKTCVICRCPLKIKTRMPIGDILVNTPIETLIAFPPHCWIPQEMNA
jgi:hypothetical protein